MFRITMCLIGINLASLQLGCSWEPSPESMAVEDAVVMPEDAVVMPEAAVVMPEDPVVMPEGADLSTPDPKPAPVKDAVVTFGAGCFWCTEAVFLMIEGVTAVESGYAGGFVKNPTYAAVCDGATGHAEVCRISYDPDKIGFDELLKVFWMTHNPTTLNQQGRDHGTQYRSVVFYHDETQKEIATKFKKELDASGAFPAPIVTEISPITEYYKAEEYHQNYFERNPFEVYCQTVVRPKIEKLEKAFEDKLKTKP